MFLGKRRKSFSSSDPETRKEIFLTVNIDERHKLDWNSMLLGLVGWSVCIVSAPIIPHLFSQNLSTANPLFFIKYIRDIEWKNGNSVPIREANPRGTNRTVEKRFLDEEVWREVLIFSDYFELYLSVFRFFFNVITVEVYYVENYFSKPKFPLLKGETSKTSMGKRCISESTSNPKKQKRKHGKDEKKMEKCGGNPQGNRSLFWFSRESRSHCFLSVFTVWWLDQPLTTLFKWAV